MNDNQTNINLFLSNDEIISICAAIDHILFCFEEERKSSSSPKAIADSGIMEMIRIAKQTKKVFSEKKPYSASELCCAYVSLLDFRDELSDALHNVNSIEKNDILDMRNTVNRLIRKLKPICQPLLDESK